jgi:hypothetical protein
MEERFAQLTCLFVKRVKADEHGHHVATGEELHDKVQIDRVLRQA